ncbi:MAG: serine--tRNA ligase [Clostridia bacterium]|nr:serine--tRNA ligase [Clostridia bacterium]
MLDIHRIRQNPDEVKEALGRRGQAVSLDDFIALDAERRDILTESERLKSKRNESSKAIARLKASGEDTLALTEEMRQVGTTITEFDARVKDIEEKLEALLLMLPNTPHPSVPDGRDETENVEVRRSGTPRAFTFEPKAHWEIGTRLGLLDFDTASKVSGARFTFYRGLGAKLERAIINFYLSVHEEAGFEEVFPPFMVTRAAMTGTGQLPKFEGEAYKVSEDTFLIPTAEVPVTNMYREMIINGSLLPIRHSAYSACFRAEAGAAGRDTRGLIRQHQFNKVEMVKITKPEQSDAELESMTAQAEKVLRLLGLPYRVITLCSGDLGFASAKTYDIEVWMPSYNRYLEISSCSNCMDFQARRAGIRYRDSLTDKPRFAHTLNGSGVAVGRSVAAVLENFQNEDGSVTVPEVLVPFMGTERITGK